MLISNSVYHIESYQFSLISEHCIELISYLNQIQITSIPIKGKYDYEPVDDDKLKIEAGDYVEVIM